jgi:hypothetical protein
MGSSPQLPLGTKSKVTLPNDVVGNGCRDGWNLGDDHLIQLFDPWIHVVKD